MISSKWDVVKANCVFIQMENETLIYIRDSPYNKESICQQIVAPNI